MRSDTNIFEIWKVNSERLPFKVQMWSWKKERVLTVVRVTNIRRIRTGICGKAWTRDEWYEARYGINKWGEKAIGSAGRYQWIWVE